MKHGYPSFEKSVKTNLEKIKGYSAEEMAEWIENVVLATAPGPCYVCVYHLTNEKCPGYTCVPGIKEWLESEAK